MKYEFFIFIEQCLNWTVLIKGAQVQWTFKTNTNTDDTCKYA